MTWGRVAEKFEGLAAPHADSALPQDLISAVDSLDSIRISDLIRLLARVGDPAVAPCGAQDPASRR